MIKKLLATLIAVIFVCSALVACNNDQSKTNDRNDSGTIKRKADVTLNLVEDIAEDDSPYGEKPLKEIVKEINKCVVEVYAVDSDEKETLASGIVYACGKISDEGDLSGYSVSIGEAEGSDEAKDYVSLILTCYHVVADARRISVGDIDGNVYTATPVGADDQTDVCVLRVENAKLTPATFLKSDSIEAGEEVVAIGNPLGALGGTVTKGIISATNREVVVNNFKMNLLQTDAAVSSGNAGGGLFTVKGVCIGMVNAKYVRHEKDGALISEVVDLGGEYDYAYEGISFAVPSAAFVDVSEKLVETYTGDSLGYIPGRYYLGCIVKNRYTSSWGTNSYVSVSAVDEKGSFYKGGLRVDDRIDSVEYRGQEGTQSEYLGVPITITTATQFSETLESFDLKVGDKIVLNIGRGQASGTLEIEILQYVCGAE